MIKNGEPNPLNVHGLRQLDWCPPHFTPVVVGFAFAGGELTNWIYENLTGRFYVGYVDNEQGRFLSVAFEDASEASYFALFLPSLIDQKFDF